ncbi:HpcH/HpaI aldolase family protein [Microbacterium sp.]|uniref:HpcH/HpaI aldolase family protein n=1 Tax=Microbacterium sp. TaxID=51671 RepID=UPI002C1244F2|nr:aldolase/citrate lyase family protein [Microbacterium sp.]HWL78013.1 aldolase/citrate lyase family protein [Microbacterium sp.]
MPVRLDEFEDQLPATSARAWRRRLAAREPLVGLWAVSGSATATEILGRSGADWLIIDVEHSPSTALSVQEQLRLLEAAPVFTVVRAGSKDPLELGRWLDLGARGLMIPMVESGSEAEAIVAAVRYPPRGRRGVGGGFARATRWTGVSDYLARAEESFSIIAQIETSRAIDALAEILAVDGIDAVFIGPADLAASMGHLGQPRHPDVRRHVQEAIALCAARGVPVGVNAFAVEDAREYAALGARLLAVGADVTLLAHGSQSLVASMEASGAGRT